MQWLVKVGDQTAEGPLADIETDKATMPMKSYDDGTIVYIWTMSPEMRSRPRGVMVLAKKGEDPQKLSTRWPGQGTGGEYSGGQVKGDGAGAGNIGCNPFRGQWAAAQSWRQPVVGGRLKASPLAQSGGLTGGLI